MSNRGTKALREFEWQRQQRLDGYQAGLRGKDGGYSDQYYQRGFREGLKRRALIERMGLCIIKPTLDGAWWGCPNVGTYEFLSKGHWEPVCGTHRHKAALLSEVPVRVSER